MHAAAGQLKQHTIVSIRARPGGRAMHEVKRRVRLRDSFNPRPPWRTGDACRRRSAQAAHYCFNPRPPWRTGDASLGFSITQCMIKFQSAPALEDGRCHRIFYAAYEYHKFQSAPALEDGRCAI